MQGSLKRFAKHLAVAGVVALGLSSHSVSAEASELTKVYHVYVDNEHIGVVNNKEVVEDYIADKVSSQNEETDYTYAVGEDVNYVTETVFTPQVDNQEVLDQLDQDLTVAVEAKTLSFGDNVVGAFASEEKVNEVIQAYKEKYVDADVLEKLDNDSASTEPLSVGDSHIIDVSLTKEVSINDKKVPEDQVLTVEQGVTLLEKGTLEDKKHTVAEGDVLGSIASQYDLSLEKLLELNPKLDEEALIKIGDVLNVTVYEPFAQVSVVEEKLEEEEIAFETETKESDDMYKGEEEVTQEGENGTVEKQYRIEKVNGNTVKSEVTEENVTKEATDKVVVKGSKVVPSRGSGKFQWPAVGGVITSHVGQRWGSHHKGIDISGVSNRSILAADNGTVVSAGMTSGGYGNKIVINHNNGYKTIYAHLDSISVSAGQTVEQGQKIGVMGSTGRSTGLHLHFEVYKDGSLVDPEDVL